jgi:hypothetical protein
MSDGRVRLTEEERFDLACAADDFELYGVGQIAHTVEAIIATRLAETTAQLAAARSALAAVREVRAASVAGDGEVSG